MSLVGEAYAHDCVSVPVAAGDTITAIAASSEVVAIRTDEAGDIVLVSARSLAITATIAGDRNAPRAFALFDDQIVAMGEDGRALIWYDATTGAERRRITLPEGLRGCGQAMASGDGWIALSCIPENRAPGTPGRLILFRGDTVQELSRPPSISGTSFGYSLAGRGNTLLVGSPADFRAWEGGPPPPSGAWLLDLDSGRYDFFDGDMGSTGFSGTSVALGETFLATSAGTGQWSTRTTLHTATGARLILDVGGRLNASGSLLSVAEPKTPDSERDASVSLFQITSDSTRLMVHTHNTTQAAVTEEYLFFIKTEKGSSNSLCRSALMN